MMVEDISSGAPVAAAAAVRADRGPVVWTISGTDSGGGAGLHADTRALDAFGVHGACAVAAVTAQHSLAVTHIEPVPPHVLEAQLAALADDMPPDAIKTGLLGSLENLRVVVDWVRRVRARYPDKPIPLVVDPVFGATTGAAFADDALRAAYRDELLPLATLATPNVAEARALVPSSQLLGPEALARAWRAFGARAVVVTGGDSDRLAEDEIAHLSTARLASRLAEIDARAAWAHDWLDAEHGLRSRGWLASRRIETEHDHGTGCVFASAAAAALAHGFVAADAVVLAKMATSEGLRHAYAAGSGAGPVAPRAGFASRLANLPALNPLPHAPSRFAFPEMPQHTRGLYAIVDSSDWVARVLAEGVRLVQLRIKDARRRRARARDPRRGRRRARGRRDAGRQRPLGTRAGARRARRAPGPGRPRRGRHRRPAPRRPAAGHQHAFVLGGLPRPRAAPQLHRLRPDPRDRHQADAVDPARRRQPRLLVHAAARHARRRHRRHGSRTRA